MDRRTEYTKKVIKDGFLSCLSGREFNKLTIKDICAEAGINRSTFYLHYHRLDDVLEELLSGRGIFRNRHHVRSIRRSTRKRIREITKELGIVLIFDETVSIRAVKGGLQSVYGVYPDLTVSGKTVGGGLPLGVVGGSHEIMRVVRDKSVKMSGTHHGHRLACAAGIACLNQLDDKAYEHLNAMAERIKAELNEWADKNRYPLHIFGAFPVLAYVLTKECGQRITTHRDFWTKSDPEKMQTFALEMAVCGFYLVDRGQLGLTLPMTDDDITSFELATLFLA